jgi:hypothetical protein
MDISNWINTVAALFRSPPVELDYLLDDWIRAALMEDAACYPSRGAWERLRKAITERSLATRGGMWILNEPLHEPPDPRPTSLSGQEFERAMRLYEETRSHVSRQSGAAVWISLAPSFPALVNL